MMRPVARAILPALAAAGLAGCSELMTWGNPYDTSSEVSTYESMEEQAAQLALIAVDQPPQAAAVRFTDPEIEAWRDTYLAVAEAGELTAEKKRIETKLASLKARFEETLRSDPHTRKEQELRLSDDIRIELVRLKMIEYKLETGAPRRSD